MKRLSRSGFPYTDITIRAVQPDYVRWQAVEIGMTRREVTALLGRPRCEQFFFPRETWTIYGYLQLPLVPANAYTFAVGYSDDDRVVVKWDPFEGMFSLDGKPSRPTIIAPPEHAQLAHHPRIVDMRWHPASGKYPMRYEIEIGFAYSLELPFINYIIDQDLICPYYAAMHVGDQLGRFRVRATNSLGVGEWSEFRHFDFTPPIQ